MKTTKLDKSQVIKLFKYVNIMGNGQLEQKDIEKYVNKYWDNV